MAVPARTAKNASVPPRNSTETKLKTLSNCVNIDFSLFDFEGDLTAGDMTVGGQHLPAQLIGAANKTVIRELNVAVGPDDRCIGRRRYFNQHRMCRGRFSAAISNPSRSNSILIRV